MKSELSQKACSRHPKAPSPTARAFLGACLRWPPCVPTFFNKGSEALIPVLERRAALHAAAPLPPAEAGRNGELHAVLGGNGHCGGLRAWLPQFPSRPAADAGRNGKARAALPGRLRPEPVGVPGARTGEAQDDGTGEEHAEAGREIRRGVSSHPEDVLAQSADVAEVAFARQGAEVVNLPDVGRLRRWRGSSTRRKLEW